jgi:hypothetical protein
VSSTIVREIVIAGGSVEELVPPHVCEELRLALMQRPEAFAPGTAGLVAPE